MSAIHNAQIDILYLALTESENNYKEVSKFTDKTMEYEFSKTEIENLIADRLNKPEKDLQFSFDKEKMLFKVKVKNN